MDLARDLRNDVPPVMRAVVGALGAFCIVMPAWEFRHAFLSPSILTLFFGAIVLGAWSVGGMLVKAALFGYAQRWRLKPGLVEIERRAPLRSDTLAVRPHDVARTEIITHTWESRENSYTVAVHLRDGRRLDAPTVYNDRAAAEALETRLRRALRLAD
jgi:hypothetical protein